MLNVNIYYMRCIDCIETHNGIVMIASTATVVMVILSLTVVVKLNAVSVVLGV